MPKKEITKIHLLLGTLALVAQASFLSPSAANTSPCNDSRIKTEYDKNSPSYHYYSLYSATCKKTQSGCTKNSVFKVMASQLRFVAPSSSSRPVVNCQENILMRIKPLTGGDPIKTAINNMTLSITNYTLPGHIFYPGEISRSVVELDGSIFVWTVGSGNGAYKSLNETVAPQIWGSVDRQLAKEVASQLGSTGNCKATVDSVLGIIRSRGGKYSQFGIEKGVNSRWNGNPTSRGEQIIIHLRDTLVPGYQAIAQKLMSSPEMPGWANRIAISCSNTGIITFGVYETDFYASYFVFGDGSTKKAKCISPGRSSLGDKVPWGADVCI